MTKKDIETDEKIKIAKYSHKLQLYHNQEACSKKRTSGLFDIIRGSLDGALCSM